MTWKQGVREWWGRRSMVTLFGGGLVGLMLVAGINLLIAETLYHDLGELVDLVSEADRIGHQGQTIAYHVHHDIGDDGERREARDLLAQADAWLQHLHHENRHYLLNLEHIEVAGALDRLRASWQSFRDAVTTAMGGPRPVAPSTLSLIDALARGVTEDAEHLETTYTRAAQRIHRRIDALLYGLLLLECIPMLLLGRLFRRRVVHPVGAFIDTARRFASGDYAARIPETGALGEIGELAGILNTTAATLEGTIDQLNRRIAAHEETLGQLAKSRDYHLKLFHEFPNPIWRCGLDARCDYVNRAWLDFTGRTLEEELGDGWTQGVHPDDQARCLEVYLAAFARREVFDMEYRMRDARGEYRWILDHGAPFHDLDGQFAGYLGFCFDLTQRLEYEARLAYVANHDELTGLPNHTLLKDRLRQAIGHARRRNERVTLLCLDLDHFKLVNDVLGHGVGDQFLAEMGKRLLAALREGDTVARRGGDEFFVVLCEMRDDTAVMSVVSKLLATIAQPVTVAAREAVTTASIGIALFPRDGDDVETLIKNADAALFRAKEQGRNTFCFYTAAIHQQVMARLSLEQELRRALEREEFTLHYQPQVDLYSGMMVGVEALVRWQHPERGMIPPGQFIHLAEETGMIVPLGEWVLATACAQTRAWRDGMDAELRMAVNLSARQFWKKNLRETIFGILDATGLPPDALELELTESMLMGDPEAAAGVMKEFHAGGIQLALDDFGTGYSSLNYLKRFPIDKLKIDQSFVRNLAREPEDAVIVKSVIELAHNLKMRVLAEGVEQEEQRDYLRLHGCDEVQGFLLGRPVTAREIDGILAAGGMLYQPAAGGDAEIPTLLLVDDEENVINALVRLLRKDGYRLLTTTDPHAVFPLMASQRVSVILADQRMPTMSGVELLRRVKELHPETIRMILSGYTDLRSITEAINEGAVYKFITKPWDDAKLRANLREGIQLHELSRQNRQYLRQLAESNDELLQARHFIETVRRGALCVVPETVGHDRLEP